MPSKKLTSALVATLLLSHTVLAPLAAVAQEQDVTRQVQETQRQSTDDSQATSLPETPTTSPSSEVSSNTSSDSVNEEAGQETPTQDDSQMQTETENSESSTVSDDSTATASDSNTSKTSEVPRTKATPTPDDAFTVSGGRIIAYDVAKGGTDVVIPSTINGQTITAIDDNAFSNKGLTSVTLPDTLLKIGRYAFDDNSSLTSISLPQGLTTIGDGAFRNCGLTGSLVVSDIVTYLGSQAFSNNQLTDVVIGKGIDYIYSETFINNPIENLDLGNVTTIGRNAFFGTNIDQLVIPSTVTRIDYRAFFKARINNLTLSEGLTYIGSQAFWQCQFQNLVLPDSMKTVETSAFSGGQIKTLKIGKGLKNIVEGVFGDNQIETVDLGTIETISGNNAFGGNKIKTLTLPDTLTKISGSSVFSHNEIETINWGKGLTDTGEYTFAFNQLKSITVPIEKIGYGAFQYNPLEEVVLKDTVKSVGRSAFRGESLDKRTLKTLDLGNGVESIGDSAFSYGHLTQVTLPASLTKVGSGAFSYNDLAYIEPSATNPKVSYGRQVLDDKKVVNNSQESQITINLTEVYPGIDPSKVEITRVKFGVSTSDTPFTYDKTTGALTFKSGGSAYSTIYYNYKVDGNIVLTVENTWRYINQWTVTWKDWDDSVFQKDVLEKEFGTPGDLMATYPTTSPTRLGYTFTWWSRENFGGGFDPLRIEGDVSFIAGYSKNQYKVNYDYNYPDGTQRVDSKTHTWDDTNLSGRGASATGYDFLGWEYNGQLVTSTDTIAKLLNNVDPGDGAEITLTAKWEKKKVYMTVPTSVDFGTHKRSFGQKTYGATITGDPLKVYDERGGAFSWKVTAKLTDELTNENGDQMLNALYYDDKLFSSTSAIDIDSGRRDKNISASWSNNKGLLLKVDSSKYKPGEYTSTIEWTLNDAP